MNPRVSSSFADNFQRDGFAVIPRLFNQDETAQLKAECKRIVQQVSDEALAQGRGINTLFPAGVCVGLVQRSKVYHQAVADPRLLDALETVLGPDIRFLSDKVCFKKRPNNLRQPMAPRLELLGKRP